MEKTNKVAALYLAALKAMAIIHQHNHWTTKGSDFYGDHLLFERLYDSTLENLDTAAEKFMGVFGEGPFDYQLQTTLLNSVLLKYNKLSGSPEEMSLAVEKQFLKLSVQFYEMLEEEDNLSLGMDDMIMSIASKREESVYLLQQALKNN
jgi:DNA-binding ferritin-like protein